MVGKPIDEYEVTDAQDLDISVSVGPYRCDSSIRTVVKTPGQYSVQIGHRDDILLYFHAIQ